MSSIFNVTASVPELLLGSSSIRVTLLQVVPLSLLHEVARWEFRVRQITCSVPSLCLSILGWITCMGRFKESSAPIPWCWLRNSCSASIGPVVFHVFPMSSEYSICMRQPAFPSVLDGQMILPFMNSGLFLMGPKSLWEAVHVCSRFFLHPLNVPTSPSSRERLILFWRKVAGRLPELETGLGSNKLYDDLFMSAVTPAMVASGSSKSNTPSAAFIGAVHVLLSWDLRHTQIHTSGLRSFVPPKKAVTKSPLSSSTIVEAWHSGKGAFSYRNSY